MLTKTVRPAKKKALPKTVNIEKALGALLVKGPSMKDGNQTDTVNSGKIVKDD